MGDRSGALFVILAMIAPVLATWLGVAGPLFDSSGMDIGSVPQWITVATAVVAFGVAIWSVFSQREIARKRAAMDFFIKTEMDAQILKAHADYKKGVSALHMAIARKESLARFETSEHGRNVRSYLNLHELIAVGIARDVFDDHVCYHYWSGELVQSYSDCKPFIEHLRDGEGNKNVFNEFIATKDRWLSRPEKIHE